MRRREFLRNFLSWTMGAAALELTALNIKTDSRRVPVLLEKPEEITIWPGKRRRIGIGPATIEFRNFSPFGEFAAAINPGSMAACFRRVGFDGRSVKIIEIGNCGLELGLDGEPGRIGIPTSEKEDPLIGPPADLFFRIRFRQLGTTVINTGAVNAEQILYGLPKIAGQALAKAWWVAEGNRNFGNDPDMYCRYLAGTNGMRVNTGCRREIFPTPVGNEELEKIAGDFKEISFPPLRLMPILGQMA